MAVGTTAFPTSLDTVVELVEVKNNASSTLSGNVLIGDVTIGVTDIAEFPTTGYGTLTDDLTTPTKTEIISWTGISGSNLTGCTRGTQGTSAAAFSSGNFIEVRPTAGHHEALRGAVIAIETKLGSGSAIAVNKLAALTASRLPVLDASGFLSASSVTATEAGYLSGVTSAIQTQLGNKQELDATLTALAAYNTAGILTQTAADTFAGRTITGTSAKIDVSNGDGVSGNPTLTISATYAGQSSITTLGTVTTGGLGTGAVLGGVTMTLGSDADGDIYYRSSNVLTRLPKGTALQQLRMNAGATAPEWAAAAGGGITIGTTTITSGTAGRILYETSGNVVGETAGFTYQPAASPNLTITAQAASYVGLRINSAVTPSVNIFETTVNGVAGTGFVVTSTGAPSSTGTGGAGAERFGLLSTISVARGVALGWTANVAQIDGIAIGYNASATGAGAGGIAIGTNNNAQGASIAMSAGNTTAGGGVIAIQAVGTYVGQQTVYIGGYTGPGTGGSGTGGAPQAAIAIGGGGTPGGDNNAVFSTTGGSVGDGIGRVWFGKGVTHATPTSVTINGTGGSGSNIAGADVIIAGGKNTGSPTSTATGNVRLQTSIVGAAASSLNTLVDRLVIANRKTLTDASTNLFEVALPTLKGCMGTIRYEIYASDGTDIQVRRGQVQFSAVNKAGSYTTEIAILNEAVSASTGTLTATWGITGGTNKVTIDVTPTGSLTETTYYILYTIENNSEQAITIL